MVQKQNKSANSAAKKLLAVFYGIMPRLTYILLEKHSHPSKSNNPHRFLILPLDKKSSSLSLFAKSSRKSMIKEAVHLIDYLSRHFQKRNLLEEHIITLDT
jgi:hypothetical protein